MFISSLLLATIDHKLTPMSSQSPRTVHCRPAQLLVMEDQEHTAANKGKGNKDLSVIFKINGFREQGYF